MQASYAGPLASYNSLEDEHLADYFSNPNIVKHLRRMGLVTKDGRIVNEGTVRRNASQMEHKDRTKDLLADAIVRNALEIERKRRALLRNKLEHLARIETVQRVKSQKSHPSWVQEFNPSAILHSPVPPSLSETLESHSDRLGMSPDQLFEMRRLVGDMTRNRRVRPRTQNPYEWSNSFSPVGPLPPSAPRPQTSTPSQSRRLQLTHQNSRPRTAPEGTGHRCLFPSRTQPVRSQVLISLRYTGKSLHLEGPYYSSALSDVLILQQHCGGNTVQLYKGRVRPRELFTFESKRHLSMPFGLTIYLDGMMDSRVSACCEYRHQCGKLLGSKRAHFRLIKVEGGRPCVKCIAESERKEKKEKLQRSLEEAISSGPSKENDEELNQLLARNTSAVEAVPPSTTARNTSPAEAVPPSTTARDTSAAEAVPPSTTARDTSAAEAVPPSTTARDTSAAEAVPPSTTARNTSAAEAVPPSTTAMNTSAAEAVPPSTTARNTSAAEAVPPSTIGSPPNSQTQVDKEQEPQESDGETFPESEQFETDAEDSERQATGDMYEDDFVKSESQHSSSSYSSANEESKTRTASISSTSSRLSEESSSPDVKEFSPRLSETKSIPVDVSAKILSNPNMAPAVNASEESVFEESEIEDNVEQQDDKQMESTDSVQQPAMSPIEQTVLTTDDLELEQNASENHQPISEDLHDTDVRIQAEEKDRTIIDSLENEITSSVPDQPKEEPVITSHQSSPQLSQVNIHPENVATTSSSLSASFTLKEAVKALEKTHSLHSILNDNSSKTASSVDLSEPDEDIPNLEQKILELPNPNFIEAKQTPPTKTENQQTVQNEGSTQEVNNVLHADEILDNQADADREPRGDHFESDATSSHLLAAVESSTATLATEDQASNTTNTSEQDNSLSQLDDTVFQSENESNIEQNQLLVSSPSPRPSSSLTSVSSHSDNVL